MPLDTDSKVETARERVRQALQELGKVLQAKDGLTVEQRELIERGQHQVALAFVKFPK